MTFRRSLITTVGASLAALVLAASAGAATQTFPQTVVDGPATSLAPTGLVFTLNNASSLTISYNAQTNASIVATIKAKGFRGAVACSGESNGSKTLGSSPVQWLRSSASVTVSIAGAATVINSCQLSQYADSSQPVIVYFNSEEAQRQETKIEVANLPKPTFKTEKSLKGKSLGKVIKVLQEQNPGVVFKASPGSHNPEKYSTGVVYVRRSHDGRIVEFQKLADGSFFVQVYSNKGKLAFDAVVSLSHLLAY